MNKNHFIKTILLVATFISCSKTSSNIFFDHLIPDVELNDPNIKWEPSSNWTTDINKLVEIANNKNNKDSLILFVGSSTFTEWKNIESYFPKYNILNNGFGGSQLVDIIFHYQQLIKDLNPKVLVLYYGDNDIAKGKQTLTILFEQRYLIKMLEVYNPDTKVLILSVKLSPARDYFKHNYIKLNKYNANYIPTIPKYSYLDINTLLLGPNGSYNKDLFQPDLLHLNHVGYKTISDTLNVIFKELIFD